MMLYVDDIFPIILYVLGSILLVALIVLIVKLIKTVNKVNEVVEEIDEKQKKLDGIFNVIDSATDTLSILGDKVVGTIASTLISILKRRKKKDIEDEEEI